MVKRYSPHTLILVGLAVVIVTTGGGIALSANHSSLSLVGQTISASPSAGSSSSTAQATTMATDAGPATYTSSGTSVDDETGYQEVESLNEAQAAVSFEVKKPTTLPPGYSLHQIMVGVNGARYTLWYTNADGKLVTVSGTSPQAKDTSQHPYNVDDRVQIDGNDGLYFDAWEINGVEYVDTNGAEYFVQGPLNKSQIISIAESLENVQ